MRTLNETHEVLSDLNSALFNIDLDDLHFISFFPFDGYSFDILCVFQFFIKYCFCNVTF